MGEDGRWIYGKMKEETFKIGDQTYKWEPWLDLVGPIDEAMTSATDAPSFETPLAELSRALKSGGPGSAGSTGSAAQNDGAELLGRWVAAASSTPRAPSLRGARDRRRRRGTPEAAGACCSR